MKFFYVSALCVLTFASFGHSTEVRNCANTKARLLESGDVTIANCPKNKCILKRNTEPAIEIKIIPKRDFQTLDSKIQGIIVEVPVPFPGFYGTSACPYMYDAAGEKKVGCPLKAGQTYTYKNSFKILPLYPPISLEIHWALGDKDGDVVCFEIPAKIRS